MKDTTNVLKKLPKQRKIGDASLNKINVIPRNQSFNIPQLTRGEVIKNLYVVAPLHKAAGKMRADEPSATCNNYLFILLHDKSIVSGRVPKQRLLC